VTYETRADENMIIQKSLISFLVVGFLLFEVIQGLNVWSSVIMRRPSLALQALSKSEQEQTARDLTNHALWITFDGFNDVVNFNFAMELKSKFKVEYSRGLTSYEPGFWRVVKYEDGREQVEATHPLSPEYMFMFDLQDKQLLWRGDLDIKTKRITNGVVIANKKRFGIVPYTETVATWNADVLEPGETLPNIAVPRLSSQRFNPPDDFLSPLDMDRYPQVFSSEFRKWFFSVEEALSKGKTPPQRPKAFFVPEEAPGSVGARRGSGVGDAEAEDDLAASRREIKTREVGGKSKGKGF
jgi:hypothetical protein